MDGGMQSLIGLTRFVKPGVAVPLLEVLHGLNSLIYLYPILHTNYISSPENLTTAEIIPFDKQPRFVKVSIIRFHF